MIDLKTKPTLQGSKVTLRPFDAEDVESIQACIADPEVIKLTGSTQQFSREALVQWYSTRNEHYDRLDLAIVDNSTNLVVGEVVVNEYDPELHSMNFRILMGPRGRNRGLGTEATTLMIDHIFQNTDLKQLTLGVYAFNPRAQRVYEKVGFVLCGVEKGEFEFEGEPIDLLNMVLTRENWVKRQGNAGQAMA